MDNENRNNQHGILYKLFIYGCIAVLFACMLSVVFDLLDISIPVKDMAFKQWDKDNYQDERNQDNTEKTPVSTTDTAIVTNDSENTDSVVNTSKEQNEDSTVQQTGTSNAMNQLSVADMDELDNLYYYKQLSDDEKTIYVELLDSLKSREDKVLTTLDPESVDRVYQYVMNDHPEIFYTSGYNLQQKLRNDKIIQITFRPSNIMTEQEINNSQVYIDEYVKLCFAQMPAGLDQYGQVKFIYDYIVSNTDYELGCENNQNICSVFILNKSVCQGYSKAMQYLLRKLGYNITLVFGEANGGAHTWNLIEVDGAYYYLDATWGDAGYLSSQNSGYEGAKTQTVNYDYLLITTELITKTHRIDQNVPLPLCNTMNDNYYCREDLYFTQADDDKMASAFNNAYASGQTWVSVMCSDMALYESMKSEMIDQQKVFDYMKSSDSVSYTFNDDVMTLTFWLTK